MRDHQQLSFRVPQELTSARAAKGSAVVIQKHFTELQKIIRDRFLIADKIWNMDECGFCVSSRLQKFWLRRMRGKFKMAQENSNEHISVCPTILAAGALVPPLLVT